MKFILVNYLTLHFLAFLGCNTYVTEHEKLLKKVLTEFNHTYGLEPFTKGGGLSKNIASFDIGFYDFNKTDNNSAKKLFRDVVERFYEVYNTDDIVRPYLDVIPFDRSRIGVSIHFKRNVLPGEISIIRKYSSNIVFIEYVSDSGHSFEEKIPYDEFVKNLGS